MCRSWFCDILHRLSAECPSRPEAIDSAKDFSRERFPSRRYFGAPALNPDFFQAFAAFAQFAVRAIGVVTGIQLSQVVERKRAEADRVGRRLVNEDRQAHHARAA